MVTHGDSSSIVEESEKGSRDEATDRGIRDVTASVVAAPGGVNILLLMFLCTWIKLIKSEKERKGS